MMYVNVESSFISDNPYYFYNDAKSPKTPDSSSKGFSFFKRRNSKGSTSSSNANCKVSSPQKTRPFNSATLSSDASILGSPRGSLRSLGSYNGNGACLQDMELQSIQMGSCRRSDLWYYRERLGSYNESTSYSESDDVFVQGPSVSRTLTTRTLSDSSSNGPRRHSVGNFTNRDRNISGSFLDEVPKMVAPKPPTSSQRQRHRDEHKKDNCRGTNMDDILIITAKQSERAILWANFLKNRFDKITKQRGRQPFNFIYIKMDEGSLTPEIVQKCSTTILQIVILCPALVSLPHSVLMSQLSKVLNPEKVLGILLEVTEDKVLEIHKTAFPSFRRWRRCVVRDHDQSFVGNVLGIATDILGRALCQRPLCHETSTVPSKSGSTESFTVVPRKVKVGQNKVMVLLLDPLQKDDVIKIIIEKAGDIIEITNYKKRNPYTLQFNIPESCMEISTMIDIRVEKNEKELGSRPVKCESRLRELEQLLRTQTSPIEFMCHSLGIGPSEQDTLDLHLLQCFQRNIPPNFHLLSGPSEKLNGLLPNKETSAEEYPTLLHFAAKMGLERLCLQLLECPGGDTACELKNASNKTPSDLAEQEGHLKLAKSLKNFSQINEFTTMYHYFKGISDTSANKIIVEAQIESPSLKPKKMDPEPPKKEVESRIQVDYMEMSGSGNGSDQDSTGTLAVTNLNYINIDSQEDCNLQSSSENLLAKNIDQVKVLDETEVLSNVLKITEPPYYQSNANNKSDQFSQECSNLLENCNTSNTSSQADYILQPSNIPVHNPELSDYLTHPSNRPVEMANYMNEPLCRYIRKPEEDDSHFMLSFEKKGRDIKSKNGTLKRNGSTASKGNVEDELAEILTDFKNNVLSIKEVEQLVDKWKNRNDVKQSVKEKQEQLEKMREEYERIQRQIKDHMKRPTPFERIRKFFSRSKSNVSKHTSESEDSMDTKSCTISFQSNQRPISSLSLQSVSSSSSSGRMSTGSACSGTSLGDSGTHSDHEDRRTLFAQTCRPGCPGSLLDNYMIPPAPRPVLTPGSTPTSGCEEKDRLVYTHHRTPTPTSPVSEHYVMFPSNIPVYSTANETTANCNGSDSLPYCGLNTIVETKETPPEVNITLQPIKVQKTDIAYTHSHRHPCSSFKPSPTHNGSVTIVEKANSNYQNDIADIRKEMSDIYKNINGLNAPEEKEITKVVKNFKDCSELNFSRQNSIENQSSIKVTENNDNNQDHEYMNI